MQFSFFNNQCNYARVSQNITSVFFCFFKFALLSLSIFCLFRFVLLLEHRCSTVLLKRETEKEKKSSKSTQSIQSKKNSLSSYFLPVFLFLFVCFFRFVFRVGVTGFAIDIESSRSSAVWPTIGLNQNQIEWKIGQDNVDNITRNFKDRTRDLRIESTNRMIQRDN